MSNSEEQRDFGEPAYEHGTDSSEEDHELESVSSGSTLSMGSAVEDLEAWLLETGHNVEQNPEWMQQWQEEIKLFQEWESKHRDMQQAFEQTKSVVEHGEKYLDSLENQENTPK